MGHDGMHAVLLTEDGSVFFTGILVVLKNNFLFFLFLPDSGTPRRGEDGDQNKVRRQPKPVKPKKMVKVDGQHIKYVGCNNGTTALINNLGELLLYGKDTSHVDPSTGKVY